MDAVIVTGASPKDIATLVAALQERRCNEFDQLVIQAIQDRNESSRLFQ